MDWFEAVLNVYDRVRNYFEEEEDEDTDEQRYNQQMNESTRRFDSTRGDNLSQFDRAMALEREALDKTQFNFENATQIRAADMQAAGLNPLNLVGGAEGQSLSSSISPSATASNGSMPQGRKNSNPQVTNPGNSSGLIDYYFRHKENEADRKNAKDIAQIQANAQKESAASSLEGTKYSADLGFTSTSEANDIARLKVIADKEARQAELIEKQFEFDTNLEKDIKIFNEQIALEANKIYHEDKRTLATLNSENFRNALNAFNSAIHNSMDFALSINKLRLERDKFEYSQDYDKKKLALENTKIALDNAARQMESITGLAGDVCKSFIIGSLSSGRK